MRKIILASLLAVLPTAANSQIVSDWNQENPVISTWGMTEYEQENTNLGGCFQDVLQSFGNNEMEQATEDALKEVEGLPAITKKTVKMGDREIILPSMIAPDGTDMYMLFEEGIHIYMAMNPPAFYEELDYDTIRWIRYYAYSRKEYTGRIFRRYESWKDYIEECFRAKSIPKEMGLLCLIESGCTANAVSRAGATGMWQFMPETAMEMGLEITPVIDDRCDPYKSTKAAARYLETAYRDMKNWTMAAASYNCGIGRTKRIIKNGKSKEWTKLKGKFPEETQQYIPALTAIYYVWTYRKELGL